MFKKLICGLIVLISTHALAADIPSPSVVDLSRLMNLDQMIDSIDDKQVLLVGETHDRYDHHLNQLAIIQQQFQHHPKMVIGLEFFQRPYQSVLDRFIAGEIDEKALLKETEYFERWGYDYRLYRPIFDFARQNKIPLIALNIDRDITDQIKKEGIDSLTDIQKDQLPDEIDRNDDHYRKRLEDIFKKHPHADEEGFESFMEIQLLWDESMAQTAADWFNKNPQGHMVILAGSGHIVYGSGIPNRLQRRVPVTMASIINASGELSLDPHMGDFIIMTEEMRVEPSGKLGVILDTKVNPPQVIGFSEESGAKKAGVEEKDTIVKIDDIPISNFFDVRYILINKAVDDKVTLEIERESLLFGKDNHTFEIILKR